MTDEQTPHTTAETDRGRSTTDTSVRRPGGPAESKPDQSRSPPSR
jgi:hypothetical protein